MIKENHKIQSNQMKVEQSNNFDKLLKDKLN